ncbi:hypothetical protein FACS1894105_03030 [Clostridia bacterium]|nr:hypothetical protein FACS1894105_03030 [Clostridia bacterium]GHV31974.1 hypothetical protein FACS18949_01640 [Clostridia bacterium]
MAFSTQFPIRITLSETALEMLLDALKGNEEDYVGHRIADEARALREKIERYGRRVTDENGDDAVRLGFYDKEGVKFIWQFIAASIHPREYHELIEFSGEVTTDEPITAEAWEV